MATTPNMNLVLPTVSVTVGPTFATMQNQVDETVDSHDHTFGKGVRIPPSGLDISSELAFGGNPATELQSTQFESQTTALTGLTASLYFLNGDLYAIDGDGTSVRVTENGSLSAAGTGTIAGLPSGTASAAFSASTFTFKASTNRYATMVTGPLRVRRGDEDNPNSITLQPPASLAGSYSYTLPGVFPATTQFLTVDNGGTIGGTIATSLGITRAMQAAVGQITSTATVGVAKTNTSPAIYETLTLSITTTGRPIVIGLLTPAGTDDGYIGLTTTLASQYLSYYFDIDGSAGNIGRGVIRSTANGTSWFPLSSITGFHVPAAGAHTITLYASVSSALASYIFAYAQLYAYEL